MSDAITEFFAGVQAIFGPLQDVAAFGEWATASLQLMTAMLAVGVILALSAQALFDFGLRRRTLRRATQTWFRAEQGFVSENTQRVSEEVQRCLSGVDKDSAEDLLGVSLADIESLIPSAPHEDGLKGEGALLSKADVDRAFKQLTGERVTVFNLGPDEVAASFDAKLRSATDSETILPLAAGGRSLRLAREDIWLLSALVEGIENHGREDHSRIAATYFQLLATRRLIRMSEHSPDLVSSEDLGRVQQRYDDLYRGFSSRLDEAMDEFQAELQARWTRFQYRSILGFGLIFVLVAYLGPSPVQITFDGFLTALVIWVGASLAAVVLRSGLARTVLGQSA